MVEEAFPAVDLVAVAVERFRKLPESPKFHSNQPKSGLSGTPVAKDCQDWKIRNEDPSGTNASCLAKEIPIELAPIFYKGALLGHAVDRGSMRLTDNEPRD